MENTNKIGKIYLNLKNIFMSNVKRKTITIFLINIMIVIFMLIWGAIQFETIDDYMIYELLSGKFGEQTEYTIYLNIFLSKMLCMLFKYMPTINWYVLMLLITHITSFTVLGCLITKKFKNGMSIYAFIIIIMYIPFLLFLQYTSQAAILILVGSMLIYNAIMKSNEEKGKCKLVLASFMIVLGSLIRFGSILYILPYLIIILTLSLINKEQKTKGIRCLFFYLVVFLCCCIFKYINNSMYTNNSVYNEYLKYNKFRTVMHDYLGVNYNQNKEVYDSANWSENDYTCMLLFDNADNVVFNIDKMQYIISNVKITFPGLIVFF